LARGIFDAQPKCISALKYVAVEISAAQRALHPSFVESMADFPDKTIQGVVLANELLDNLPFKLFVYDGEWMEAFVGLGDGGRFVEILRTVDNIPEFLPVSAPLGSRVPIQTAASQWLLNVSQKLSRGRVLVFDYCSESTSEIANTPWREWLRTYKGHERGVHYLLEPGSQDITTQVMVDQLAKVVPGLSVTQQSEWLLTWGIDELVSEGSRYWEENKSAPDIAAMKMRSRVNEAQALTDRDGLGAFWAIDLNIQ
jgi:SAM-dependent MidA family methyltransferase